MMLGLGAWVRIRWLPDQCLILRGLLDALIQDVQNSIWVFGSPGYI